MTFKIDENGLLSIHAEDVRTKNSQSLIISHEELNLPREEIARLVEEGEFEQYQSLRSKRQQKNNPLLIVCSFCAILESKTNKLKCCSQCMQRAYCSTKCQRKDWLKGHKNDC